MIEESARHEARPGQPGERRNPGAAGHAAVGHYMRAAALLVCDAAAIEAVAVAQPRRAAFDEEGRATIRFERHVFRRLTAGRHDGEVPDLSNAVAGGYGHAAEQYQRLARARCLDETAALCSCSWGRFQIMGFDHARAGYRDVHGFIAAMQAGDIHQLDAFVAVIQSDRGLLEALRSRDFARFAALCNGTDDGAERDGKAMRRIYATIAHR